MIRQTGRTVDFTQQGLSNNLAESVCQRAVYKGSRTGEWNELITTPPTELQVELMNLSTEEQGNRVMTNSRHSLEASLHRKLLKLLDDFQNSRDPRHYLKANEKDSTPHMD